MNGPELLERIMAAGVRLSARGDKIVASPREAVTPELLNLIRDHKPQLLQSLEAQQAELRVLVGAVATFHGFTLEQTAEAQQIAQADPVAALECFRLLAAKIPKGR